MANVTTAGIVNPLTPMAYLPMDVAYPYKVTTYVEIGSLGALLWDILLHVDEDYKLLFKKKIRFPTIVYFFSRASVLVYTILNVVFLVAPLGHLCHITERTFCVLYHTATSSTALLFFLRVIAVYNCEKAVCLVFFILWLAIVAGSLTAAAVGGALTLDPTSYCIPKELNQVVSAAPLAVTVFDTSVFLAISYRLLIDAWKQRGEKFSMRELLSGKTLPRIPRVMLQDGQVYYLVSVISNIIVVTLAFVDKLPPTYRFMLVFNCVLVNMLAGRVFRKTKFGFAREAGINSPAVQYNDVKTFVGAQEHALGDELLPGPNHPAAQTTEDLDPEDPRVRRMNRLRTAVLSVTVFVLIVLPFICVFMCRQLKDHDH